MNSNESWEIKTRESVYKILKSFPKKDCDRIILVVESLGQNPFAGDIQKMAGDENVWRRRVGNYRIFYEIISSDKVVYFFHVERRNSKTY